MKQVSLSVRLRLCLRRRFPGHRSSLRGFWWIRHAIHAFVTQLGRGVDSARNDHCATLMDVVSFDRSLASIIPLIAIIGAGIRVGRGRVM